MSTESVILVVGNESTAREAIVRTLEGERLRVVGAENSQEAVAHLDDSVDLVISELQSSAFDGLELLRTWKERRPQTPFVLVTDGNDVSAAVEAMKLGAADCIVKPIDAEELRNLVATLLKSGGTNGRARQEIGVNSPPRTNIDIPPGTSLEDLERAAVEQALAQHHGNRTHAAKTLGISVRTLQRKLKAWGMPVGSSQNHNTSSSPHFLLPTHASTSQSAYSAQAH